MKQIYVPELEAVFDVYGTVIEDGELCFVVWNNLIRQPEFQTVRATDVVRYDGEELAQGHAKEEDLHTSAKYPDEQYDPADCDNCDQRFECFPWMRKTKLDSIKSDEDFKKAMDAVAKSRERVFALKRELERAVPWIVVTSIEVLHDGGINVNMRRKDSDPRAAMGAFQDGELSKIGKDKESGK